MRIVESLYRRLPAVQRLLEDPDLQEASRRWGHDPVVRACRHEVDALRRRIDEGELSEPDLEAAAAMLPQQVRERLRAEERSAYPGVINATGVLIHTNLGRAPLPAPPEVLTGYLALEYELAAGRRGQRLAPLARRIAQTCSAEAAVMVNNNAAALLLALGTHAKGREVVVSRSQLIEIGGSFRLPDVMAASGCVLVEVGCTNRTHLRDYERAIGPGTAAILVAHQSNFRIVGFTTAPEIAELAELAHRHDLPLLVDQGSGALHDLRRWGLAGEPTCCRRAPTWSASPVTSCSEVPRPGSWSDRPAGSTRWPATPCTARCGRTSQPWCTWSRCWQRISVVVSRRSPCTPCSASTWPRCAVARAV